MTDAEYEGALAELDRLLNDVDVPMQPDRVWALLGEVSHHDHVGPHDAAGIEAAARYP